MKPFHTSEIVSFNEVVRDLSKLLELDGEELNWVVGGEDWMSIAGTFDSATCPTLASCTTACSCMSYESCIGKVA